jgi:hypothetical protein
MTEVGLLARKQRETLIEAKAFADALNLDV